MRKLTALFLILFSTIVTAHDLFLNALPFTLEKPGTIRLSMNLAAAFPGKHELWRKDKTAQFRIGGPAGEKTLQDTKGIDPTIELAQEGTYVIGWEASPTSMEIDAKHFNEYIQAEGYTNVIDSRKQANQENAPGREKYTRFLKAFVQVGSKLTDHYSKPLGQRIEIIPQSNPYQLKAGDQLKVKVLFDGKPLAGATAMATYDTFTKEHDVYAHTLTTGNDGTIQVPISKDGIWMIRVNTMQPLQSDLKADWQSYWANCSFQVSTDKASTEKENSTVTNDTKNVELNLRERGLTIHRVEEIQQPFFASLGKALIVDDDQMIQVFEFTDPKEAKDVRSTVSPDGMTINKTKPFWAEPPHFFAMDRLIIFYVGENEKILKILNEAFGPQFAGK